MMKAILMLCYPLTGPKVTRRPGFNSAGSWLLSDLDDIVGCFVRGSAKTIALTAQHVQTSCY